MNVPIHNPVKRREKKMAKKKRAATTTRKSSTKKKRKRRASAATGAAPRKRRAASKRPATKKGKRRRTRRNPDTMAFLAVAAAVGAGFAGFVAPALAEVAAAPAGQATNPTVGTGTAIVIALGSAVGAGLSRPGALRSAATGAAVGASLRLVGTHAAQRAQAAVISARNTMPAAPPPPAALPAGTTVSAIVDGRMQSVVVDPSMMAAVANAY